MNVWKTVAGGQTDDALGSGGGSQPVAKANHKIIVIAIFALCAGTATTLTLNSKGSGAGAAISPALPNGANGGFVLPPVSDGWFETLENEALTVTTGAGGNTALTIIWDYKRVS